MTADEEDFLQGQVIPWAHYVADVFTESLRQQGWGDYRLEFSFEPVGEVVRHERHEGG
jgi:hypothetical protein